MHTIDIVLLLVAVTAIVCIASQRLKLPRIVLLVAAGVALACVPGLPPVRADPDVVFQVFVPPLLYRAATQISLFEFRRRLAGIAFLSFTMVLVTMAAVAVVAHLVIPGMGWAAAFALGAIVAPPDSVAAISLTRSIPLPRGVVTLLRGEGLVNDAAAFVSYRMAVAAMVTGTFSFQRATSDFVVASIVGIGLGVGVGWGVARLREQLRDLPVIDNTVSLLTPFAVFTLAERLGASGVLAIVATGLILGRWAPRAVSPATRLQANALWDTVVFLLESLIFVLVGYELPGALAIAKADDARSLALASGAVAAAVILSRLVLVGVRPLVDNALQRLVGLTRPLPSWSSVLLVGWAGVRGGDSLVIALALPMTTQAGTPLPSRDLIIFLTITIIVITLVVQGLSFEGLTRLLELKGDVSEREEERLARNAMRTAGLGCIQAQQASGALAGTVDAQRLSALLCLESPAAGTSRLAGKAIAEQRRALLDLFDEGRIGDVVMRRSLEELDLLALVADMEEGIAART